MRCEMRGKRRKTGGRNRAGTREEGEEKGECELESNEEHERAREAKEGRLSICHLLSIIYMRRFHLEWLFAPCYFRRICL